MKFVRAVQLQTRRHARYRMTAGRLEDGLHTASVVRPAHGVQSAVLTRVSDVALFRLVRLRSLNTIRR